MKGMYGMAARRRAQRRIREEEEGDTYPTARLVYEEERAFLFWRWVIVWECECTAICSRSSDGADADGNRSWPIVEIDEFIMDEWQRNGKAVKAAAIPQRVQEKMQHLAEYNEWHIG